MCVSPIPVWLRRVSEGKQVLSFHRPSDFAPIASPTFFIPCGKCALCRESKRKDWSRRIIAETWLHDFNSFVTLTYSDEFLPSGSLASKSDIQKFIKRLRQAPRDFGFAPRPFKYYIVSEYGSKFGRPHYHGIIFGLDFHLPNWSPYFVRLSDKGFPVYSSRVLEKVWKNGFLSFDRVTPRDIAYVTKYISKSSGENFALYSRGLGKGLFFDANNELTPFGDASFDNGFLAFPSGHGSYYKAAIPKNIDRYLSLYEPLKYAEVHSLRQHYASLKKPPSRQSLADGLESAIINQREENQKRILDNET